MITHFIVSVPTQTHREEQISLLDFNKTLIIMTSKSSVFYIASKFPFCPKTGSYAGFRLFLLPIPETITFGSFCLSGQVMISTGTDWIATVNGLISPALPVSHNMITLAITSLIQGIAVRAAIHLLALCLLIRILLTFYEA